MKIFDMFFNETELVMLIVALVFVVVGGIGIALVLEMRDKTLRTEGDIKFFLGIPTLALIPLNSASPNGNKRRWPWIRRRQPRPATRVEA